MLAAFDYYSRADEEFEQHEGDHETRLKIFFELSRCNTLMDNYRTALRYVEKAEKLAAEHMKHLHRLRARYGQALCLEHLDEKEKAERLYLSSLKEAEDNSFLLDVAIINNNLGYLYHSLGRLGQALAHLQRARNLFELMNEEIYLCDTYQRTAEIMLQEGDQEAAMEYVSKIMDITDRVVINTYRERAQALRLKGKIKESESNFEEYVENLHLALQIYEHNYAIVGAYEVSIELAEAYYQRDNDRSLDMYRRAIEFNNQNKQLGLRR
jgi:tetratricopeptide (TPR) repeat protein